jgi:hypothetical protein
VSQNPPFAQSRRGKDEALNLASELADEHVLTVRILIRVAKKNTQPGIIRPSLHGPDERRKERISDIGYNKSDIAMPPCAQGARGLVRHVAEALGDRSYMANRLVAQEVGTRESP